MEKLFGGYDYASKLILLPGSAGPKPEYLRDLARPIWSGTISFGLVSAPVKMYPATESKELRFHFLHKPDQEKPEKGEVGDLMAALRESVEPTKRLRKRRPASKRKAS